MSTRSRKVLFSFSIALMLSAAALVIKNKAFLEAYYEAADHCRREGLGFLCARRRFNAEQHHPDWATQNISLSDGEKRRYLLCRPSGSGPKPTIIVLHGVHGDGLEAAIKSGLGQFAPYHGFVGVFPDARAGLWNAFPPAEIPESVRLRADKVGIGNDVLFLRELLADLVHRRITDPQRVYVSGLSMGGFMALDMACADAADLKAVTIVGSSMPETTGKNCSPVRPTSLLVINGTADQTVPYAGGPVGKSHYTVWSTDRTLEFFRRLDGCHGAEHKTELSPLHRGQLTHVTIHDWKECSSGKVTLYRVQGGEHEFPPIGLNTPSVMIDFFNSIR